MNRTPISHLIPVTRQVPAYYLTPSPSTDTRTSDSSSPTSPHAPVHVESVVRQAELFTRQAIEEAYDPPAEMLLGRPRKHVLPDDNDNSTLAGLDKVLNYLGLSDHRAWTGSSSTADRAASLVVLHTVLAELLPMDDEEPASGNRRAESSGISRSDDSVDNIRAATATPAHQPALSIHARVPDHLARSTNLSEAIAYCSATLGSGG